MKLGLSSVLLLTAAVYSIKCDNFQQHVLQDKDIPIIKSVAIIGKFQLRISRKLSTNGSYYRWWSCRN